MSTYEEVMNTLHKMDEYALKGAENFKTKVEAQLSWVEECKKEAENYKATGTFNRALFDDSTDRREETASEKSPQSSLHSVKENANSSKTLPAGRQLRSALKEPSQLANIQGNATITIDASPLQIKMEKMSLQFVENPDVSLQIKKELIDMPPPKPARPLRKKKTETVEVKTERLTTRLRKDLKLGTLEQSIVRESDVQVQEAQHDVVMIDSDDETPRTRARTKTRVKQTDPVETTTRSTRTKTRNRAKEEQQKRLRSSSPEDEKLTSKPAKARKLSENNENHTNTGKSASNLNVTVVISKKTKQQSPNATYKVSDKLNGSIDLPTKAQILKDLMTDDEDVVPSSITPVKKWKGGKQIFSPYGSSPVKNKVEAFEKLAAQANNGVPEHSTPKRKAEEPSNSVQSTRLPRIASASAGIKRVLTPAVTSTLKSKSAMKASQAEYRQRAKEAHAKKEALIQVQIDEKRRKREEKQLKAQKARDDLIKSKQSALEKAAKAKREKSNLIHAEKEDKLAKKRELSAQREAAVHKRAMEIKNNNANLPLYLRHRAPLLPTTDCYDSDDDNAPNPVAPPWQSKRKRVAKIMIPQHRVRLKWYSVRPQTVDLREMFPTIDPSKLKRNSSAVWNGSNVAEFDDSYDGNDSF